MSDTQRKYVEYSQEIAAEICLKTATTSMGIASLCKLHYPNWPNKQTIMEWRLKYPEFGLQYAQAKRDQIETIIDEIIDIADDTSNDTIMRKNKDGSESKVCNTEYVNRSRLRIDSRKWLAGRLAPKIYGDKLQLDSGKNTDEEDIKQTRDLVHKCSQPPAS